MMKEYLVFVKLNLLLEKKYYHSAVYLYIKYYFCSIASIETEQFIYHQSCLFFLNNISPLSQSAQPTSLVPLTTLQSQPSGKLGPWREPNSVRFGAIFSFSLSQTLNRYIYYKTWALYDITLGPLKIGLRNPKRWCRSASSLSTHKKYINVFDFLRV